LDEAFVPLTPLLETAWTIDGLAPAETKPRQRALMSPRLLVCRATPEASKALDATVDGQLSPWLALIDAGVRAPVEADLPGRDRANRALVFEPGVDPVWEQVTRLIGAEQAERVRGELLA